MATTFSGEQQIEALYVGYFGRAGDPVGLNYWLGQLANGSTIQQIAASFAVQTESTSMYPYLANPQVGGAAAQTNFINQIYQDLFNHAPDVAGLAYWQGQLTAANGSPQAVGQMIINIETGAQGSDATILQNKVTVANFFTDQLLVSGEQYNGAASSEAHSSVTGTTGATSGAGSVTTQEAAVSAFVSGNASAGTPITLTTGIDNVTGSNLAISGVLGAHAAATNTLNVGDVLSPTGNNNSLNVTVTSGGLGYKAADIPTLTNIQALNINNVGGGDAFILTGIAPALTTIGASGIFGNDFTGYNGAQVTTYNVSNINGSVTEAFDPNAGLTSGGAASGTATVNLSGVAKQAAGNTNTSVEFEGGAANDGYSTVGVNSVGSVTNDLNALVSIDNGAASVLKTLAIAGSAALNVDNSIAFAGGVVNIQAGTDTGGLTLDVSGNTGKATFVGGTAGKETLIIDETQLTTTGTSLQGGAGTSDTLQLNVAAAATLSAGEYTALTTSSIVSGFEILGINNITNGTLTVNAGTGGLNGAFTQFTVSSTAANDVTNITGLANNSTINQLDGHNDTFAGAIGATSLNLNIGTATSGLLSDTDTVTGVFSTINLAVNGTSADVVTFVNNAGDTFNVTGSAAGLQLAESTGGNTGDIIKASGFTGALQLADSGANDTISTGSGITTITENNTTLGDTITLLAGHTQVDTLFSSTKDNTGGAVGSTKLPDMVTNFVLNQDHLGNNGAAPVVQGTSADMNGVTTGTGIASQASYGTGAAGDAAFIAAAYATTTAVASHAVAYFDGANTLVAEFIAGGAHSAHIVELVGVNATAIGGTGAGHILLS